MFGNFYNSNKKHTCTEIYLFLKEMKFFYYFWQSRIELKRILKKYLMKQCNRISSIFLLPSFQSSELHAAIQQNTTGEELLWVKDLLNVFTQTTLKCFLKWKYDRIILRKQYALTTKNYEQEIQWMLKMTNVNWTWQTYKIYRKYPKFPQTKTVGLPNIQKLAWTNWPISWST